MAEQLCAPVETGASQLGNSLAGKDMEVPVDTKLSWRERQLTASWAAPKNITSGSRNMIILLYSTKESQTGGSEFIAIFVQKLRQKGFLILRRESLGALFDMYKLWCETVKKTEADSPQQCPVIGCKTMGTNSIHRKFHLNLKKTHKFFCVRVFKY